MKISYLTHLQRDVLAACSLDEAMTALEIHRLVDCWSRVGVKNALDYLTKADLLERTCETFQSNPRHRYRRKAAE